MDMKLPAVCAADRRTNEIPIIFLTEKRERIDRLQGFEVGADDYITKPFDVQELRLRVRNALKRVSQGSLTNPVSGLPEGPLGGRTSLRSDSEKRLGIASYLH